MRSNDDEVIARSSLDALRAIRHYRRQRRTAQSWMIGDRRVSAATISNLENRNLVKEIWFRGTPVLVLTDEGRATVL